MDRAINAAKMGRTNKLALLDAIRKNPGISRLDLARTIGLDPSTVSKIVSSFMQRGLVRETGTRGSIAPGRRSVMLSVVREATSAIAVAMGVEHTRLGVGYLDGKVEVIEEFESTNDLGEYFDKFVEVLNRVKTVAPINPTSLSFSVPGIASRGSGTLLDIPHMGWKNVDIRREIVRRMNNFDLAVYAANEAKLSLFAEIFASPVLADYSSGIYVYVSQGIGGAVWGDYKVHFGASNIAGEIGHHCIDLNGPQCSCGRRGCFECFVSIDRVVDRYEEASGKELAGKHYRDKFRNFVEAVRAGDEQACAHQETIFSYLGEGLANIVNCFDPHFILIGGMGSVLPDSFMTRIHQETASRVLSPAAEKFEVIKAALSIEEAPLIGATLTAMDCFAEGVVSSFF